MKRLHKTNLWTVCVAVCLLAACHGQTVYHSFLPVSSNGWSNEDTLTFHIGFNDSTETNIPDATVEIRYENSYPYQDLYLFVCHNLNDSAQWENDTLHLTLSDEHGNKTGKGWGGLYLATTSLAPLRNCPSGERTLKIVQGMTDTLLQGIHDVGIHVTSEHFPHAVNAGN